MKTKTLFELLQAKPTLAMRSTDDTECKALFSTLGILDEFTRNETPNTSMLAVEGHPTHWIFGCCYSGNSDQKEKGYGVACMPKMSCSRQNFCEFVDEMVEQIGGTAKLNRLTWRRDDWRAQN